MKTSANGIEMIKAHEGLRLIAYPDPASGGEPWTIGYGHTKGVYPGMQISEEQAERFLREDLAGFERAVLELLPIPLTQSEFDALVSFAFNVGAYALETSTLRKRLVADEPRCWAYQKELPRWNQGANGPMPGLTRRRQEEADLACLGYLSEYAEELPEVVEEEVTFPLDVPYYTQLDSEVWGQAERSCFSSAMAMALDYINPDAIQGDDDWYLRQVLKNGDTVSASAQIETAQQLGFAAEFHMDGTESKLLEILDSDTPVPIGILHKGYVDKPTGGGHWITLIGYDDKYFYVNDPMGDLDLIGGGYPRSGQGRGAGLKYTRKNIMKRWLIDGSGKDGWFVDLR